MDNPFEKIEPGSEAAQSADIIAGNIERLQELFPEAFTEGRIDFEVLRQLLGDNVDEREEKYGLNWHGKRKARQLALTPSTGTLRPCREESVDWDTTQNLMIEGDNLEVLKLLQKSYSGKVKMIYIDPPYNTGKDFVYKDDFRDNVRNYQMLTGQVDSDGRKIGSNTDTSGRFHTDWLNLMFPRLIIARDLLRSDGIVFVSIDDHEVANLRSICDNVFGEENLVGILVWQHSVQPKGYSGIFSVHHNFVLCYQRSTEFKLSNLDRTEEHNKNYSNPDNDPKGPWRTGDVRNALYRPNLIYDINTPSGNIITPPANGWRWSAETLQKKIDTGEIVFSEDETRIIRKIYLRDLDGRTPETLLFGKVVGTTREAAGEIKDLFNGTLPFDTPKPTGLLKHLINLSGAKDSDIILDYFAGSGTTTHATWRYNAEKKMQLRAVLVQLQELLDSSNKEHKAAIEVCDQLGKSRNIAELTKERLRRAGKKIRDDSPMFQGDLGFRVFKLDSSNIRAWQSDHESLEANLLDSVEHIVDGRTEADVLYEVLLKLGLDLCVPIETRSIAGKTVYSVGDGAMFACLAESIELSETEELGLGLATWRNELAPAGDSMVVLRDSAFADDVAKTNLAELLKQHPGFGKVRSL